MSNAVTLFDAPAQMLTYRKQFSPLYLPDDDLLKQIDARLRPFGFPIFDATIGSQQTGRSKYSTQSEAWITSFVASSSQVAGFAAQIYDSESQQLLELSPLFSGIRFGTAQRQFWLKRPYRLPAGGQLQTRIINLATASNAIQLVAWGLR